LLSPTQRDFSPSIIAWKPVDRTSTRANCKTWEKRYEELLPLSYPIHRELLIACRRDWATLDRFQRARGVLRFLANVIGMLWHSETRDTNHHAGAGARGA
jgi:predicted AAA+ superfamily ATPase